MLAVVVDLNHSSRSVSFRSLLRSVFIGYVMIDFIQPCVAVFR